MRRVFLVFSLIGLSLILLLFVVGMIGAAAAGLSSPLTEVCILALVLVALELFIPRYTLRTFGHEAADLSICFLTALFYGSVLEFPAYFIRRYELQPSAEQYYFPISLAGIFAACVVIAILKEIRSTKSTVKLALLVLYIVSVIAADSNIYMNLSIGAFGTLLFLRQCCLSIIMIGAASSCSQSASTSTPSALNMLFGLLGLGLVIASNSYAFWSNKSTSWYQLLVAVLAMGLLAGELWQRAPTSCALSPRLADSPRHGLSWTPASFWIMLSAFCVGLLEWNLSDPAIRLWSPMLSNPYEPPLSVVSVGLFTGCIVSGILLNILPAHRLSVLLSGLSLVATLLLDVAFGAPPERLLVYVCSFLTAPILPTILALGVLQLSCRRARYFAIILLSSVVGAVVGNVLIEVFVTVTSQFPVVVLRIAFPLSSILLLVGSVKASRLLESTH